MSFLEGEGSTAVASQRVVEGRDLGEAAEEGLTARLAEGVVALASRPLPPEVSAAARTHLLDALAAAISAAHHRYVDAVVGVAGQCGGTGTSPVPGRGERLDPGYAAMAAGLAAHLDDAGDTHPGTDAHLGTGARPAGVSMAAALSVATAHGCSGRSALVAFALGCEVQLRVGRAVSPAHDGEGWDITGTCGVLGAAVTASLLLGADPATLNRSLGVAASETLGLREGFGTGLRPFHAGKAAANGVLAARLAGRGFTASERVLEAPRGFLRVLSPAHDPAPVVDSLGERWDLLGGPVTPHPLSRREVEDRARRLVEPRMPGATERLIRSVDALEDAPDLIGMVGATTPRPPAMPEES